MCKNVVKNKLKQFLSANYASTLKAFCNVDDNVIIPALLQAALGFKQPVVVVFPSLSLAENGFELLQEWSNFINASLKISFLPEVGDFQNCIPENEASRAKILFNAANCSDNDWFVTSAMSCFSPIIPPALFSKNYIRLEKGREFNFTELKKKLVAMDYDNEFQVNTYGEFAVRGGMIDIYSPLSELPARIEFWDNEIDEIRLFNPATQKSVSKVNSYTIIGRTTIEEHSKDSSFLNYFQEKPKLLIVNPEQCNIHLETFGSEFNKTIFLKESKKTNVFHLLDPVESANSKKGVNTKIFSLPIDSAGSLNEEIDYTNKLLCTQLRVQQIQQWIQTKYLIALVGSSIGAREHLKKWCLENDIPINKIVIEDGKLHNGIIIPEEKIVILTEKELFFIENKRHLPSTVKRRQKIIDDNFETANFAELDVGNYAVHITHGIGIFNGITEITVSGGNIREVMEIEYDDEVKLYVPTWQAGLVSRYIGSKKSVPRLNKIGGTRWGKMKIAAVRAAQNMALDMLNIQAMRHTDCGYRFPSDDHEQAMFEGAFPYHETIDQIKAAEELKADMNSSKPMDRLICGDVGYGKTEVAMRGAFKAVMDGKQVAILVPTTILAQQHYYSFLERFAEYPIIIEMLSRFRSKSEQKEILEKLKEGTIDIIIGTHRLAQNDVQFASLGLIIIDEEQRFGVMHKERLKKLKATVDVLSMTATPIPRTLYLAMSGIRDLSTIMTAPNERLPIQTMVCQFDEKIIVNAIVREIQRGGQVFYVHNRVKTIEARCKQLQELIPDAICEIGHGQMHEHELEEVMGKFIEGKIDVLVCTTIIESGVDIPNTNTIIIERADRFGLAELYQLRGRVGRWSRQAYAYLLLPIHNVMTGNARARLAAIRKYTQLGAGFRLALKDLEIRGAGNILGASQSGHINAIGFELYCQLLKASIAKVKGQKKMVFLPVVDLTFDFLDFGIHPGGNRLIAGLPQDYIPTERLRVDFYRRFSAAVTNEEISSLQEELKDRFGVIPKETLTFIRVIKLRLKVALSGFTSLSVNSGHIFIEGGGGKTFLINGKIPKLKNSIPTKILRELEVIVSALNTKN
jgi:transcription-repair coupling factor (superfamily II helicase)